jgi:hypothetical protein
VVLVHGLGGSGKTELAKAFALWLAQTGWATGTIFFSFEPGVPSFGLNGLVAAAGLSIYGTEFVAKTEDDEHRRAVLLDALQRHSVVLDGVAVDDLGGVGERGGTPAERHRPRDGTPPHSIDGGAQLACA